MNDQEFLEKASQHKDYTYLTEYKSPEEVGADLLKIKRGEGITEENWERTFYVHRNALKERNPEIGNFLKDINAVFEKYKDKGITEGSLDIKGSTEPFALNIVKDILNV